jgi:hypothetical protein
MEGALMTTPVALDASPAKVLSSFRGSIIDAHVGYPGVIHLEVRDRTGGVWRFATQDAEYTPSDPGAIVGREIDAIELDGSTGRLRLSLSDDSSFVVTPNDSGAPDDPPNWELISPDGIALEFGPGLRWQIAGAAARSSH